MTDDDDLPDDRHGEIDWTLLRKGQMDMAEVVYCYHQALVGAGFNSMTALQLTGAYQWGMMVMGAQ